MGKALYRAVLVILALQHSRAFKFIYGLSEALTVFSCEEKLSFTRSGHSIFGGLINVPVSVPCNCNRLLPGLYVWLYAVCNNRSAENRTVQNGTNGSVGAFPHFLELVLFDALGVGGDGCALYAYAMPFYGFRGLNRDTVVCFIPLAKTEIIVLRV